MTQSIYQIVVKGQLDTSRSEWFEGWIIRQAENNTTILTGQVADQSALHGILVKIFNLNLPVVLVQCMSSNSSG